MPRFGRDLRPAHMRDEQLRRQKPLPLWLAVPLVIALLWGVVWPIVWIIWQAITGS